MLFGLATFIQFQGCSADRVMKMTVFACCFSSFLNVSSSSSFFFFFRIIYKNDIWYMTVRIMLSVTLAYKSPCLKIMDMLHAMAGI